MTPMTGDMKLMFSLISDMVGPMMGMLKNIDLGGIMGMIKEKPINLERLIDLKDMAWKYLENKGVPSMYRI